MAAPLPTQSLLCSTQDRCLSLRHPSPHLLNKLCVVSSPAVSHRFGAGEAPIVRLPSLLRCLLGLLSLRQARHRACLRHVGGRKGVKGARG